MTQSPERGANFTRSVFMSIFIKIEVRSGWSFSREYCLDEALKNQEDNIERIISDLINENLLEPEKIIDTFSKYYDKKQIADIVALFSGRKALK